MLASENTHKMASRMEKASTARKSPINPDATPTPTTGCDLDVLSRRR
jgi:hypothetical protein